MTLRAAAWVLLVSGVTISTLARDPHTASAVTDDGYRIVTADFHVHGFLGDGALPPWDLRREAARRGVDVIGLTNHNQMYAARLDRALFQQPSHSLSLIGEELTTPNFHLIALGIREPIDWRSSLLDAIRAVHAQGGVAIAAHPNGDGWQQRDPATLAALDGLEVAHPITAVDDEARQKIDALYERARTFKPTIAPIGSSDYHFGAPIGFCRTRLLVREVSAAGVLDAIRAGRTVAYDTAGQAYGQARWVAAVSRAPAPASPDSARQHAAMFAAWLALLILVVFGTAAKPGSEDPGLRDRRKEP